ncbi:MAG: SDR family oxidoreductase [Myxococcales bacterium]|nr:SDR family oxidoreductase [Myxococcales bacterium]
MTAPKKTLTIVLTGCASGIGRQLATDLYRLGHRIVATDVNDEAMRRWGATHWPDAERAELLALDVREAEAWERVLDRAEARFGQIDVLMNVAGYLVARWSHETSVADVGLTIDVNVKGVIFGTNAAVRRMLGQGHGHVINVASIAGIVPVPGLAAYCASKHAVRGFSVAVAQEVREHGVHVTVVCPGPVATPMLDVQLPRDEAAITFSGARALAPEEVSTAIIERALGKKPLELVLPAPRSGQRVMAKLVGAWPELGSLVEPVLTRIGRRRQERLRRR